MSQRIPLDRGSLKLGLSKFFQRLHKPGLQANAVDWGHPRSLPDLLHIQQKIEGDEFDLAAVLDRVVKVAWRELGAEGAGVWLFTNNEIFFCAGAGSASNDERLRLIVLSTLAAASRPTENSRTEPGKAAEACVRSGEAGPASSQARSLLVEPISQDEKIAGVLAVFSSELEKFTERDSGKIQFLADLLAQALGRGDDHSYIALELATMLELVEGMIPALQNMLSGDERSYNSTDGFGHATTRTDPEPDLLFQPDDSATLALPSDADVQDIEGPSAPENESAGPAILGSEIRSKRDIVVGFVRHGPSRALNALIAAGATLAGRVDQLFRQIWQTVNLRRLRPTSQPHLPRPQRFRFGVWARANFHFKGWFRSSPILLTATPVLALLVMAIAFMTSKAGHYMTGQTKASGLSTTGKTVAADVDPSAHREIASADHTAATVLAETRVAQPAATPSLLQVSHLRVTDRTTQDALRTLSHYELVALRRRALYGDDFAAFLIGMAYETGYGLQQDCKTAALWVTKAASQGNSAAEYNLGLRYRDGDGVPVDQDAALKWLRKAAARHVFGAQVALMAAAAQ